MYTSCMFCKRDLGRNEVVESFPVGRRLAFDAERGRLWVVCRHCERWNLTPLEERWEAVEDAERIFRATRLRAQTPEVGLARTTEGLELVRIGNPLREEFAAWRYGDQFGRRRRKAILYGAGVGAAILGVAIGGIVTGLIGGAVIGQTGNFVNLWNQTRTRARLRLPDGSVTRVKTPQLHRATVLPSDDELGWALQLDVGRRSGRLGPQDRLVFEGEEARRVTSVLIPAVNAAGGSRKKVQRAVHTLEEAGHPEEFLKSLHQTPVKVRRKGSEGPALIHLPPENRLALEMALHEEQEMRALQGELWRLRRAWEEAEEIAAIADNLFVDDETEARLTALRSDPSDPVPPDEG